MFHIDNPTGVPVMPPPAPETSNTPLFFTEGGNGISPTYPGPDWFNIVQTELLNILIAANIAPKKNQQDQVLAALKKLFAEKNDSLGALASLTGAADKLPYFTGAKTAQLTSLTEVGRGLIAAATKEAIIAYIGGLKTSNNLSEIATAGPLAVAAALSNLGLGEAAKRNVGTTANTVAAGDDPRIGNAVQQKSPSLVTAFVNFSVSGGVVTINDSYNVSSVVRTAAGRFNVIFTNAMKNAFYCPAVISRRPTGATTNDGICYGLGSPDRVMNVNQFPISINNAASTAEDPPFCCVTVSGGM